MVGFLRECIIWHQNVTKIVSFVDFFFLNTVPRVSLFFTLSAAANTVCTWVNRFYAHANVLKASETRELAFFSLKKASSIARGSSPYQAAWTRVPSEYSLQLYLVLSTAVGTRVWWHKLESRGTSLEKFSYRNIALQHTKLGSFGRLALRATCCTRNAGGTPLHFKEFL